MSAVSHCLRKDTELYQLLVWTKFCVLLFSFVPERKRLNPYVSIANFFASFAKKLEKQTQWASWPKQNPF